MSLKYEPSSEPLHISAKWLFLNWKPEAGSRTTTTRATSTCTTRSRRSRMIRSPTPGSNKYSSPHPLFFLARIWRFRVSLEISHVVRVDGKSCGSDKYSSPHPHLSGGNCERCPPRQKSSQSNSGTSVNLSNSGFRAWDVWTASRVVATCHLPLPRQDLEPSALPKPQTLNSKPSLPKTMNTKPQTPNHRLPATIWRLHVWCV